MRGFLIQQFLIDLRRLDPDAIQAVVPDDGGAAGYDADFQEPRLEDPDATGVASKIRREMDQLLIPAQIEPDSFQALAMLAQGDAPQSAAKFTLHFRDLERLGLVGGDGNATIRVGDRVAGIYDRSGVLVQTIPDPPGVFVTEALPEGWGLGGMVPRRNLLILTLGDRPGAVE